MAESTTSLGTGKRNCFKFKLVFFVFDFVFLFFSFRMFFLLFVTMTITWVFFLMSFSKYDSLIYSYIIVNALQGPTLLYICLFDQKHVSYLIRKTCCYVNCICPCCRPDPECEWGDEMTAMNTDIY